MVSASRLLARTTITLLALGASSALAAPPPIQLRNDIIQELRKPRPAGETIVIRGIDLGGEGTDTLELEPMEIWAPDAQIFVWSPDGTSRRIPVPKYENFKGRVVGDDESSVFVSYRNGRLVGSIITGRKKFNLGTAFPVRSHAPRYQDPDIDLSGERLPILLAEVDDLDSVGDPAVSWTCDTDRQAITSRRPDFLGPKSAKPTASPEAGGVAGATYSFKLVLETDNELCTGFADNTTSITNYMNDLIAKSNIIYQRDVGTTLVIGTLQLRTGGSGDPWTKTTTDGTFAALLELGTTYHNTPALASIQRSEVSLISGKAFFGGIAWIGTLCDSDFFCGADGSFCGSAAAANQYGGGYAMLGSFSSVSTTNADPTTTIAGHEFAMPNANNFWVLAAFTHELGHNVASPHSWCVPPGGFTAPQKTLYGIGTTSLPDRNFVDISADGGSYLFNLCYNDGLPSSDPNNTNTFPTEWGTIMSYSHNHFDSGNRASRYIFGKSGEASELMLPIMTGGVDAATPNGTITIGAAPIPCAAGQTASVPNVGGLTYSWQITGGTITSSATTASITYTPNAPNVTVTVTITNTATNHGCSITTSATRSTACAGLAAPTNVVATATTSTNVAITWDAVGGATNYKVLRSSNGSTYGQVGNPASSPFNDATAVANTAYLYKVLANNGSSDSGDSNRDLATTVIFTDPTLTAGSTTVKTAHITQLRTAVNAVRTLAALGAGVYTDPSLTAGTTSIKRLHIVDLRTALDAARTALTLSAVSYTDPTITVGSTAIKAAHVNNLRGGVQ